MKSLILVSMILLLASCSHKARKQEIKQQVEQSSVKDPAALSVTIDEAIESSQKLTQEQKQELHKILAANKQRAMELTEQSFKLRGVLIQELLSGKVDHKKVRLIKKDIKKIEGDKLKNTFETVEKITGTVSKNEDRGSFTQPLMMMDRPLK